MKRAIISDIHGNLEALEAVLSDIAVQGIEEIDCLGDIVGYGPNPRECVDRVMRCRRTILGNHDQGALFDPEGFSSGAERAIFWTRGQLENAAADDPNRLARWNFLAELPRMHREPGRLLVHGSPRSPLTEYVFPEDVYDRKKLDRLFSLFDQFCFQGHTHVPGVFTEDGRFLSPTDLDGPYRLDGQKAMINVGSVGQPRDNDPRACYVVLTDEAVEYRRVPYPVEVTAEKIYAVPELDDFLGDRLKLGR